MAYNFQEEYEKRRKQRQEEREKQAVAQQETAQAADDFRSMYEQRQAERRGQEYTAPVSGGWGSTGEVTTADSWKSNQSNSLAGNKKTERKSYSVKTGDADKAKEKENRKKAAEKLKEINWQLSAMRDAKDYSAAAREKEKQLRAEKDRLEQQAKVGLYDEDLSFLDRAENMFKGIGESYNATPDVLADTAAQAAKDAWNNRNNTAYHTAKDGLADVNNKINAIEYRMRNGFATQAEINSLAQLKTKQAQHQAVVDKYTTPLDMNTDSMQKMQRAMQYQQKMTEGLGTGKEFLWNTASSIVDNASMMPLAMMPGGQTAVLAAMGAKSAAMKAVEVGEKGGSAGEALLRGLSSGAIEAATEKLPLDNLVEILKGKAGRSIIKNALIQAFGEGAEETVSYLANLMIDKAAQDPDAKFSINELFMSFLGGALSGGVMGGGATLVNNISNPKSKQNAADTNAGNIEQAETPQAVETQVAPQTQVVNVPPVEDVVLQSTANTTPVQTATTVQEAPAVQEAPTVQTAPTVQEAPAIQAIPTESRQEAPARTPERIALEKQVQEQVGIDTRTEVEKEIEKQTQRLENVQQLADSGLVTAEQVQQEQQTAQQKVQEASNRQANLDYQQVDRDSGRVREKALAGGTAKATAVKTIEKFAEKRGLKVKYYEADATSYGNGYIEGDTIFINMQDPKAMYKAAIHEVMHGLRTNNPQEYKAVYDGIMAYAEQYASLKGYAQRVMDTYLAENSPARTQMVDRDGNVNTDLLHEEVLVNLAVEVIDDPEGFINKVNGDRNVLSGVRDLLRRIKNNLAISLGNSEKARLDNAVMMLEKYMQGKADAEGLVRDAEGNIVAEDDGKGSVKYNLMTYDDSGREYLREWLKNSDLSKEEQDEIFSEMEKVYKIAKEFKDKYPAFSNWSEATPVTDDSGNVVMSVIVPNGEYKMNIDFSTICKKRKALDAVLNEIVRSGKLNLFEMSQPDIVRMNEIIKEEDLEIACALCFVDAKRYRIGNWANSFADYYNTVVQSLIPKGSDIGLDQYNFAGADIGQFEGRLAKDVSDSELDWTYVDKLLDDSKTKPIVRKIAQAVKDNPNMRRLLSSGDLLSSAGADAMKAQNPTLYGIVNTHMGTAKPKTAHSETPYINDILRSNSFSPEAAYAVGGVRIQSFSDYVPSMLFDYVQMVGDLAAKKLPAHAYTKETAFVKIFGKTGIKINMSLVPKVRDFADRERLSKMPLAKRRNDAVFKKMQATAGLDENGNYLWADETFDYDEAIRLQNNPEYSKNIGTIAVGVSDAHIRKLMADDNIRMVIPYHKSGINHVVASMNNIDLFMDYTKVQNTRYKSTGKKIRNDAYHFDFYADLDKTNNPRQTAENYVKDCESRGFLPKFDKFAYTTDANGNKVVDPNYYKLLIDFAVYDNGEYTPQGAVRMEFPDEENLKEYVTESLGAHEDTTNLLDAKMQKLVGRIEEAIGKKPSGQGRYSLQVDDDSRYSLDTDSGNAEASQYAGMTIPEMIDKRSREFTGETAKSRNYQQRAENYLAKAVANAFGVKHADKVGVIKDIVKDISAEVKTKGYVSRNSVDRLVDMAFEKGFISDNEMTKQYPTLKKELRMLKIKYNAASEVYRNVRNEYLGKLTFAKEGTDVDILYGELNEKYPALFPDSVTNPEDQIVQIGKAYDLLSEEEQSLRDYYGESAAEMKDLVKEDLRYAINRYVDEVQKVDRYEADRRTQQGEKDVRQKMPPPQLTMEEYRRAQHAVYEAEKVVQRLEKDMMLTEEDKAMVKTLLAGGNTDLVDGPNRNEILAMYAAKKAVQDAKAPIKQYQNAVRSARYAVADKLLTTFRSWTDKKAGLGYSTETFERNLRDIIADQSVAQEMIDTYITPIHKAEADSVRLKNKLRKRIKELGIDTSTDNKKGKLYEVVVEDKDAAAKLTVNESGLVQLFGEGKISEAQLKEIGADIAKIKKAVEVFKEIYAELYDLMDASLLRNGYKPMGKIKDYFPHFTEENDTVLSRFAAKVGLEVSTNRLPTSIAGITDIRRPGRKHFRHLQTRTSDVTLFDAVTGFDQYIDGAASIIYQTDNIQNLRALENRLRYLASDQGLRERLDEIDNSEGTAEEKQARKDHLYGEAKNLNLGKFVAYLRNYTNNLAGKKSIQDRGIEHDISRGIYTVSKALEGRIASNMIGFNIGSALTNFIPIAQMTAEVDAKHIIRAAGDALNMMYGHDDDFEVRSDFLTNRFGSDKLVYTWAQKLSNKAGWLMTICDEFTSNVVTRGRYLQNIDNGMDADEAMKDADRYAANVLADRSKGAVPLVFERKNPLAKAVTMFQIEQNNQLRYLVKDLPKDLEKEGLKALTMAVVKYAVASWLFNCLYELIVGRRPAFDPIDIGFGIAKDVVKTAKGEQSAVDTVSNAATAVAEELPFTAALNMAGIEIDAGRIPMGSALPNFEEVKKLFKRDVSGAKKLDIAAKELMKPVYYLALPTGGGQVKKVAETVGLYKRGGVEYSVQSDGTKKAKFAVDTSNPFKAIQSAAFGKWSTKEAREYIENNFKGLTAGQTENFEMFKASGMSNSEAWAKAKGTKALSDKQSDTVSLLVQSGMTSTKAFDVTTSYRKEADTNGNDSLSQEEAKAYLSSKNFTKEQKAILFSCMCPNAKTNPYK